MSHDRLASQEPLGESDREYGSVGVAMGAPEHQPLSECPVQNPNEIDDATKRLVCWVVFWGLFIDYCLMTMVLPILPSALQHHDRDVPDYAVFLLSGSKALAQLITNSFAGAWVDSAGTFRPFQTALYVLFFSTAMFTVGMALVDVESAPSWVCYTVLLVARCIQGIASSVVMSSGMALVMMVHSPEEQIDASGFVMRGLAAGIISGPLIGGGLSALAWFWTPFLPILVIVLIVALYHRKLEDVQCSELVEEPEESADFSFWRDPMVWTVSMAIVLANTSVGLAELLVPWVLKDPPFDYSTFFQGLVYLAPTITYMSFTPLSTVLAHHLRESYIMQGGIIMSGAGLILLLVQSGELWCILVGFGLVGGSAALVDVPSMPQLQAIAVWRGSNALGSLFAIQDASTCFGFVLGPLIGALVRATSDASYTWASTPLGIVVLALTPVLLVLRKVPLQVSDAGLESFDDEHKVKAG